MFAAFSFSHTVDAVALRLLGHGAVRGGRAQILCVNPRLNHGGPRLLRHPHQVCARFPSLLLSSTCHVATVSEIVGECAPSDWRDRGSLPAPSSGHSQKNVNSLDTTMHRLIGKGYDSLLRQILLQPWVVKLKKDHNFVACLQHCL